MAAWWSIEMSEADMGTPLNLRISDGIHLKIYEMLPPIWEARQL